MKISEVLEKFLEHQTVIGNTIKTIHHYKTHVEFYMLWSGDIDVENFTYDENYAKYIVYLRNKTSIHTGKKLSSRTIYTYAESMQAFFKYAYLNCYIKEDIYSKIKLPKFQKKVKEILAESQIKDIMNYYDNNSFLGARNNLIISLMLDAGLRLSEITNLSLLDFSRERKIIKVNGKGQKQRLVPLTDNILFYFENYLNQFEFKFAPVNPLLINRIGQPMTSNSIKCLIQRLRKNLNIPKLHPHLLRHTFATLFIYNGGDPLHLMMILGHTTLNMTMQYVHLANQMRVAEQSTFTPLTILQQKN